MNKGIFITGTDTGIGKTIAACCIIKKLRVRGIDCGVMKPVQCAGNDAGRLVKCSGAGDRRDLINPFFSKYALVPSVAFKKQKIRFRKSRILKAQDRLLNKHQFLLVEGAGGLIVPITGDYFMSDLVLDLNLPVIIVARLGLGTINHTLLSIEYARAKGISITGVIFNNLSSKEGVAEKTNPKIIEKLSGVPVVGIIPYRNFSKAQIDIDKILHG